MAHLRNSLPVLLLVIVQKLYAKVGEDDSLNFLVIGDWGGWPSWPYTTDVEMAIGKGMGKFAGEHDAQFVLALGDNFYLDGVNSVEDKRFKHTYQDVFTNPSLGVDWYLIAGNHDHNGNVSAQIAYSKMEKRWNFPSLYYPLQFSVPSGSATVDILMLDTVVLCGNADHVKMRPGNDRDAAGQLAWTENQLKNSRAEYLIVTGHYPVLSIGGRGPTKCLVDRLQPLLHRYKASAYFCGHDHNLQHLQYTHHNATVEYFVSGAANFVDNGRQHQHMVPPGSSKFFWGEKYSSGGFGFVKVAKKHLSFSFFESNGKKLYEHKIHPRHL